MSLPPIVEATFYTPGPKRYTEKTVSAKLLVVDDDEAILRFMERFARSLGFDVHVRNSGPGALASLSVIKPDVVLVDLTMPELTGIDVLRAIRVTDPECHVILMTGNPSVDTAIEAVKAGALDYLAKPVDTDRLRRLLNGVLNERRRRELLMDADEGLAHELEFQGMIGRSPKMQKLFDAVRRLAPHARTVLVTGETGTGKELVAKALHALGPRHSHRLLTLNCSAVVENLFESELFGHVRGAFTGATDTKVGLFEHADGGTLFLDEAGELPMALQAKMLRAIENGEMQRVGSLETRYADVSVIAATNRDLRAQSAAGTFRADLFYRLSVIEIHLPPLRERREDIPYLTAAFVKTAAKRLNRTINGVTRAAEDLLQRVDWPGNLRELRNVLERACIMSDARILTENDIAAAMAAPSGSAELVAPPSATPSMDPHLLSTAQRDQVQRAMETTNGNKTAAAKLLGVSRRSLYRWIERLNVTN